MGALDLEVDPDLVVPDVYTAEPAERELTALLDGAKQPTALVTGNNMVTLGSLYALNRAGLRESIAIVGFDDLDLAPLMTPGLTVLAQHIPEIGRTACDRLFSRLERPERIAGVVTRVPVTLIPRGSGEIPAPSG
jgi:LacI family transcriptional regulator